VRLLTRLHEVGVRHVIFNLKYGRRPAPDVMRELADEVLPAVHAATALAQAEVCALPA
jgi:hypothetical protein